MLILSLMMIATLAIVVAVVFEREGLSGIVASAIAASVCWAAAVGALLVTRQFTNTTDAVSGVLGATLIRTGVPMAAAVLISSNSPTLAAAGVFGKFVIFFLVALAVETCLSVSLVNAAKARMNSSPSDGSLRSAGTP